MSEKAEENNRFLLAATSPHVRSSISVNKLMFAVIGALLLPTLGGVYYFGWNALFVILTTVITSVLTEFVIKRVIRKTKFVMDGSAIVTGLLLGLILPPLKPQYLWMAMIGAIVAIAIAKEAFGGLGHNIFNPALVGRAFMAASFTGVMTTWAVARGADLDAFTGATPLKDSFGAMGNATVYKSLFLGNVGGSIGETSALLILIGGVALILLNVINWRIPLFYIGMVFALTPLLGGDPVKHILAGGLFLGAFFMATDYVTAPLTDKGKIYFAVGAGILTVCIRKFAGMPEGVCFSILLMNAVTPLIDRYTRPIPFGYKKPEKKKVEEKPPEITDEKKPPVKEEVEKKGETKPDKSKKEEKKTPLKEEVEKKGVGKAGKGDKDKKKGPPKGSGTRGKGGKKDDKSVQKKKEEGK